MYPLLCFKPRVLEYELLISKKLVHSSSFISSEYFVFSIGVLMCWFTDHIQQLVSERQDAEANVVAESGRRDVPMQ